MMPESRNFRKVVVKFSFIVFPFHVRSERLFFVWRARTRERRPNLSRRNGPEDFKFLASAVRPQKNRRLPWKKFKI
jgi:hypothetical protein